MAKKETEMNINFNYYLTMILFMVNLCFSKDEEGFLFKNKYDLNEKQKYKIEMIMEFSVPGVGDIYFNFGAKISHEFLGEENENGILCHVLG